MENEILQNINKAQEKKRPRFVVGDKVNVSVRLKEGEKERIQALSWRGHRQTSQVRQRAQCYLHRAENFRRCWRRAYFPGSLSLRREDRGGVFEFDVRRSRLYYLRALQGKKARLKESERFGEIVASDWMKWQRRFLLKQQHAAPVETAPAEDKKPKA